MMACLMPLQGRELDNVRVKLKWYHQFQFAGYYAAIAKGYYADVGLDVELLEGRPTVDPAEVVLSGEAEYGVGTPDLLLEWANGDPIVVLGVIFQHSPYVFLSLEDSEITDITALAGKRVMIEPQAAELYAYLQREMVPLESLEILPHTFSATALLNGEVEAISAYVTDEPMMLHQLGIPYQQFNPRSSGIDFYGDSFFTTRERVDRYPEEVKAFRDATVRGWIYAMKHPAEIIDLILEEYPTRKSREALFFEYEQMRDLMYPELIPVGYMYEGRWRHIMQTYVQLGMMEEAVSLEGFLYDPDAPFNWQLIAWFAGGMGLVSVLAAIILIPVYRANNRLRAEITLHAETMHHLREAKEGAERAKNANSRFVATVSHELRTPLNGLLGFTRLLEQTALEDEQKEYMAMIATSARNLQQLSNDILDYSRIESGRIELLRTAFSPEKLVDEVRRFFQFEAEDKGLTLRTTIDPPVPDVVYGDETRVRQILFNLVSNALKFTREGEVEIRLQSEAHYENEAHLRFTIRDTGPGLSESQIERVFEPFVQADKHVQREFGGTGLGLTICRRLAALMQGDVTMTSELGSGTTVACRLVVSLTDPAVRN